MRTRNVALVSTAVAMGAVLVVLLMSRGDGGARNDALLFLDRYDQLDVDDPIATRRGVLEPLETMPFTDPTVDEVRDLCVHAHRTVIRAEEAHGAARALFEQATDGGHLDTAVSIAERAHIEASLQTSEEALGQAGPLMTDCADRVDGLRLRFSSPRRR